ncbi:tyrosine-type recombinase/integrase [Streptomyces sp. NPDC088090]|uniref:tyrosine-type recombinase/integrase n=1 Tax=Streptomyces sp. NPDC088090 TaxID=3365822 RepID=UPI003850A210
MSNELAIIDGRAAALPAPLSAVQDDVIAHLTESLGAVRPRPGAAPVSRLDLLTADVDPASLPWVLKWLTSERRSEVTRKAYMDDIRTVWAPWSRETLGLPFAVGQYTEGDIVAWRLHMERLGRSKKSVARYLNTLSSLHRYVGQRFPALINPVSEDDRPRLPKGNTVSSTPVLDEPEERRLYRTATALLERVVVRMLLSTAGRVEEHCKADVPDIRVINGKYYLYVLRKGGKEALLPIADDVVPDLLALIGDRTEGPIFLNENGERLSRHSVDTMLTRLGRAAKVLTCPAASMGRKAYAAAGTAAEFADRRKARHSYAKCRQCRDLTPHVLRATAITRMLDDGVPVADVQALADHASPETTIGYWHRANKLRRDRELVEQRAAFARRALRSGH